MRDRGLHTGHCHPRVVGAVQEQAARLMHVSNLFYTEPMTRLAERLAARSLGGKVFFCNSGAEANEAALKLARKGKRGRRASWCSTAASTGARSARCRPRRRRPSRRRSRRWCPGFDAVMPTARRSTRSTSDTAAVLLEAVQGESGVHPLGRRRAGRTSRAACDEHGALLIVDEVQTGMGRTGTLWAYERDPAGPDLDHACQGPRRRLADRRAGDDAATRRRLRARDHGSTFAGSPLVSAAANAALDVLDDPALLAHVRDRGERLADGLRELPGVSSPCAAAG